MFNPYGAYVPFRAASGIGFLSKINWGSLLSNTQKTLSIVNQAIPIAYQVKPMINNAKTVLKVASEFSKSGNNNIQNNQNISPKNNYSTVNTSNIDTNEPTFFI